MAEKFSRQMLHLAKAPEHKTLQQLVAAFADKGFAVLFLLLMAIPALPLPTGGVTHIFELVVMLLALELIAGRRTIWLPRKVANIKLPDKFWTSTLPFLSKWIAKLETISRPRLKTFMAARWSGRLIGFLVLIFSLGAFLAPPFSGLDTLPSLGVVLLSLALIFEDAVLMLVGLIVGCAGLGLTLLLGRLVFSLL